MSSTREVSRRTMIRGAAAVPAVAVLPAASTALTRAAAAPDPISNPASAPDALAAASAALAIRWGGGGTQAQAG
jgi:hypothetical protein